MPSAVRVLVSTCHQDLDQRIPDLIKYSQEVRKEPGCLQFEYFRSHDLQENLARLELWESTAAWDTHWNKLIATEGGLDAFADGNIAYVQAPFTGAHRSHRAATASTASSSTATRSLRATRAPSGPHRKPTAPRRSAGRSAAPFA